MKTKRVLIVVMSLFAVTPALLGSAWGVENRAKHGLKQECELKGAKYLREVAEEKASKTNKQSSKQDIR